jgi:hypothetical protein
VQSVLLENLKTGEQSEFATDGVFIYVGMEVGLMHHVGRVFLLHGPEGDCFWIFAGSA